MKNIPAFAVIIVLVAVWPLLLVGMSVLERKDGLPSRHRWIVWGAFAIVFLGASIYSALAGLRSGSLGFLGAAIGNSVTAWGERRRHLASTRGSDDQGLPPDRALSRVDKR
jgi:hypothetical protein